VSVLAVPAQHFAVSFFVSFGQHPEDSLQAAGAASGLFVNLKMMITAAMTMTSRNISFFQRFGFFGSQQPGSQPQSWFFSEGVVVSMFFMWFWFGSESRFEDTFATFFESFAVEKYWFAFLKSTTIKIL
jgi:hypothetical protein